ncbi:TetR family transcriptional regulator [Halobacteria archaeon AArc-m2/3/4]|uniref:TetR family transcriptional regulator n=1 Tax=Natronoglomus mannanivorans TaxID=2979990 RepID=A0AAP2Z1Z9_9EURY|nr:TetR family transcriptional regulator [Halobacteria archaeon AArc-xg1-1]MCU4974285.1 TetR family transcriptional regulator [Halobacteria archaeon AArc-m2/3/4]
MTEPSVREAILTATYEALCEHGYTDLTAQAIADRTDKSKSHIFYHYDSVEDLVVDFIDFLLERFDEHAEEMRSRPPAERLAAFVDWFLYGPDDEEQVAFHTALLELRAQAPYNDRYREQLRKSDDYLRKTLEEILRAGQESGDFQDHDETKTAALLIAAFDGARVRQLTLARDEYLTEVRDATTDEILDGLLADGVAFPDEPRSAGTSIGTDPTCEE